MSRWNQARRDQAQAEAMDLYETVMRDAGEPTPNRIAAADKLLDRIEGKPVQKSLVGGANGGPLIIMSGVERAED
jgi:hypothetical protein